MLAHGEPKTFRELERIELAEFLRRNMIRATVVLGGRPYEHADTWTLEWQGGRLVGFAAHRLIRTRQFDVMHIMATYCESPGLRRALGPLLLQKPAFRSLRSDKPVYWCLRSRNPLALRTVGRFSSILTRELDLPPSLLAAACFGTDSHLDSFGTLHGSYPTGSIFLPPANDQAVPGLDYQRNQCVLLGGRVQIETLGQRSEERETAHAQCG